MEASIDLPPWRDGLARAAVDAFVAATTTAGAPGYLEPRERIAVFDNDGTLWTEKPKPVQLDYVVRQLAAAARDDPTLRARQPYKAAADGDVRWLGAAMVKHYQGDDADLRLLVAAVSETFTDVTVDEYERRVAAFFAEAEHPTFKRPYTACTYAPMVELLRHLEHHGVLTFIVSGGDRDFMRVAAEELYGIPRERVVGSSLGLAYCDDDGAGDAIVYKASLDFFDDGPQKPLHIWSRVGRRPAVAGGNSNGDVPMLRFAGGPDRPALRLLVVHDAPSARSTTAAVPTGPWPRVSRP
ncbi:hypothetical protein DSM104299_02291 [Baekduia alba]|uniref:HAD family hydrolase n=1 Tax=Baekduia alba TaxID=2997333 RepID=UPI002342349B|nr:HAD family hydrolase [Baekduia alba]WCB93578.1 hypothetical protein DSM104299_02291 [Baekduia alba]